MSVLDLSKGYEHDTAWDLFYQHGLTLIPAWISNHIPGPGKCGMKLLIHSQTSTVAPLKFGNGKVSASSLNNGCDCLPMLVLNWSILMKGAPGCFADAVPFLRCMVSMWSLIRNDIMEKHERLYIIILFKTHTFMSISETGMGIWDM